MKTHITLAARTLHGILTQSISHPHKKMASKKRSLHQHLENFHHVTTSWMLASLVGIYAFLGTSAFIGNVEAAAYLNTASSVPPKVINLKVQYTTEGILLAWSPVAEPVTDYIVIYKASKNTRYSLFVDGVSTRTAARITHLAQGKRYDFRVAAKNQVGIGPFSSIASISTITQEATTLQPPTIGGDSLENTPRCGNANATPTATTPKEYLCDAGTPTTVSRVNNTWSWSCRGSGGSSVSCAAGIIPGTQTPVNGSCGSVHGLTVSTIPTYNLCAKGTPTVVRTLSGAYLWGCEGIAGGSYANCRASRAAGLVTPVNGKCGNANGTPSATAPSVYLCDSGKASDIVGNTTTWSWSCRGSDGGTHEYCSASVITGNICGSAHNTSVSVFPTGTTACSKGEQYVGDRVGEDGTYNWRCYDGTNAVSCVAKYTPSISSGAGTSPGVNSTNMMN